MKGFPHSEQSAIISTLQSPSVRCCLHSVRRSSEEITGYVAFYFEEEEEEEEEKDIADKESCSESEDEYSDSDTESSSESEDELEDDSATRAELRQQIDSTIKKVRKLVKFFRKSPLKNEKLQTHIKAAFNHELELKVDVKTRCNSMVQMLRRVVKVKDQLLKAAIDLN